ncbi:MAG: alpha/beta fold hydrolase [Sulfurimonadaceae bacterium]
MLDFVYSSSSFMLKIIDTILQTNIHVHGEEHLKKSVPTLFVANHFTRFETLMMPYVIDTRNDRKVRSLADKSLFVGLLGTYLKYSGALSTADRNRNEIIEGDLMSGRNNWIIYPEGFMVKNKKVVMEDEFIIDVPRHHGAVFTGAALMAIHAEKAKTAYNIARKEGDTERIASLRDQCFVGEGEEAAYQNTHVLPINITYYPLRPGHNPLMNMANILVGEDASKETLEEIEIEGNLLSRAEMHVRFCEPINISHLIHHDDLEDRDLRKKMRHKLTTHFMETIYQNVLINIDHLFSFILEKHDDKRVEKQYLKQLLYVVAQKTVEAEIYNTHETINGALITLFLDETYAPFDDILSLTIKQKILKEVSSKSYHINHKRYRDDSDFHRVRLDNTLRVIYNEVALLNELEQDVEETLQTEPCRLATDILYSIFRKDLASYHEDYKQHYSVMYSKAKEVGEPFVLYDEAYTQGIVFAHGLKSSPSEIRELCEYIHKQGFNVYGVRLKGHGTLPQDLRDVTYRDWVDSMNRGYAAISQVCRKIYLGGFSTGGLVALLSASRKSHPIEGVICINSALELRDIRINYAQPMHAVNNFLALFNANVDYIDHEADYPETNYSRLYVSTLAQLKTLMTETEKVLHKIDVPLLVIQGSNDPVVVPKSAKIIMKDAVSTHKELYTPSRDHHVIIKGEGSEEVFERVVKFMKKRKSGKTAAKK